MGIFVKTQRSLARVTAAGTAEPLFSKGAITHFASKSLSIYSRDDIVLISYKIGSTSEQAIVTSVDDVSKMSQISIDMKLIGPTDPSSLIAILMSVIESLADDPSNSLMLSGNSEQIFNWIQSGEHGSVYHLITKQPALPSLKFAELLGERVDSSQIAIVSTAYATKEEEEPVAEEGVEFEAEAESEWVGDHWIQPSTRPLFAAIKKHVEKGGHFNLLFAGASGYGKTTTCRALAEFLGYRFLRVDCSKITDTEAWFGYQEARDGSTVFEPTPFTQLIVEGKAVILLDEANRIEPWIANSLFPVLDDDRATEIHNNEIKVGPSVVFALSVNLGTKYAGTHVIDAAFRNRVDAFDTLVAPPLKIQEKILVKRFPALSKQSAKEIVKAVSELGRVVDSAGLEVDLTTRTCLKIAKLLVVGLTMRVALEYVVIQSVDVESRKPLIDAINIKYGSFEGSR